MRRKKAIFAKGKKVVDGMGIPKRIKNVAQNKAQIYPEQMFSSCTHFSSEQYLCDCPTVIPSASAPVFLSAYYTPGHWGLTKG